MEGDAENQPCPDGSRALAPGAGIRRGPRESCPGSLPCAHWVRDLSPHEGRGHLSRDGAAVLASVHSGGDAASARVDDLAPDLSGGLLPAEGDADPADLSHPRGRAPRARAQRSRCAARAPGRGAQDGQPRHHARVRQPGNLCRHPRAPDLEPPWLGPHAKSEPDRACAPREAPPTLLDPHQLDPREPRSAGLPPGLSGLLDLSGGRFLRPRRRPSIALRSVTRGASGSPSGRSA